jgi:methionine sulfoxide reductase heme-binding subunit
MAEGSAAVRAGPRASPGVPDVSMALGGTVSSHALWYLSRGCGLVVLVLLTLTLALGLVTTVRWRTPHWPRFATADLHRNLSLLAVVFLAVHVASAVLDTYTSIKIVDAFVPFVGTYRPLWLGLGALALDLMLALIITSLLRGRIGPRTWRAIHATAYAMWPVAMLHAVGTGSDVHALWVLALYVLCAALVLAAFVWRMVANAPRQRGLRAAGIGGGILVPLLLAGFTVSGPLATGWAKRAGTPSSQLHHTAGARSPRSGSNSSAGASATALSLPFSGSFTGTVAQSQPNSLGQVAVRIAGRIRTTSGALANLVITLDGQALSSGGVAMTSSQVTLVSAGGASYSGQINALTGGQITMELTDTSGNPLQLTLNVNLSGSSATGTVSGQA